MANGNPRPAQTPLQQRLAARPALTPAQSQAGVYHGEVSGAEAMGYANTSSMAGVAAASQRIPMMVPLEQSWRSYGGLGSDEKALLTQIMNAKRGPGKWGVQELEGVWASGVQGAQFMNSWSGTPITPLEWLQDQYLNGGAVTGGSSGSGGGGGGGGSGGYSGPTTSYQNSVSVQITNPDTAASLADDVLSKYLGREANSKERSRFIAALNAYEEKNPTNTSSTTVSTPNKAGHSVTSNSSSRTTGGADQAAFAKEWAQSQEGASEHQAVGLLDSFMQALENPMDVVR